MRITNVHELVFFFLRRQDTKADQYIFFLKKKNWNVLREDKILQSIPNRSSALISLFVPPDDTTLVYNSLRITQLENTTTACTDGDDVVVWGLVGLVFVDFRRHFEFCVLIHTVVTQFLFDIPSNLPLCGSSERVLSLSEVLQEILCKITASQAKGGVMQSVTFADGHSVRHAVTRVHRDVRRASRSLVRHVHGGRFERLKHGLRHALCNVWCQIFSVSFQFVTIQCSATMSSFCNPPWAGGHRSHRGERGRPRSQPLRSAPRSTRSRKTGSTHIRAKH